MEKHKKIIMNVSHAMISALVTYFISGVVAVSIVNSLVVDVRGSTLDSLSSEECKTQYIRKDYASMSEREEIPFKCHNETLMGYLYQASNPHGVIICAHGVGSLADSNNAQYENYFINQGWDVFAIDMTACGQSTGKGMKTLHESKFCVKYAIETVSKHQMTKGLPIYLIGHSWGGYGVIAGSDKTDVKAVVSFAAYDTPAGMMYSFAEARAGAIVSLSKPGFDFALTAFYGNESYVAASDVIKRNRDIKYYVVQGDVDNTVILKNYSVYDHVYDKEFKNTKSVLLEGIGHSSPWKSKEAHDYYASYIEPGLEDLHKQYGKTIPEDKLGAFVATIDKEKSSELNLSLMNDINSYFLALVNE